MGVGKITKLGAESIQLRVSGLEDLKVIINHFDKYPLLTNKQSDYLLFKQAVDFMEQGRHLNREGLKKLCPLKLCLINKNYPIV